MFVGFNNQLQNMVFAKVLIRDERTNTFEWALQQFKICMDGKDLITIFTGKQKWLTAAINCYLWCRMSNWFFLKILADQDNAMENAIWALLPLTYHRFYRWHMLKKYNDRLNQMYHQHPKLKDKLIYVINHPLNPEQFEAEWATMCDEFDLHDRVTMQTLYNERRMWIAAYFKEVFCGTIQSTQRSESMNSMVKGGYLDNLKSVHQFMKRFLDALDHIHYNEAKEKYYS
jgi:hypothetical protein